MAKKRWEDLVDFSGIKKTEKDVESLEKEFVSLFTTIRSFAQTTNQEVAKNEQVFRNINEEIKKLNTSTPKQRDQINGLAKEVINLDRSQEQLKETQESQVKTVNTLNKSYKSLKDELKKEKKALDESNLATKKGQEQAQKAAKNIQKLSRETRDLQRATRGANSTLTAAKGSYNELQLETEKLRSRLRNLSSGFDKNDKEARQLKKTIFENTKRLKQFDAAVNQNFRNVGNYSKALSGLNRVAGAFGLAGGLFLLAQGVKQAFNVLVDFDKEVTNLAAIFGKTRKEIEPVEKQIREVAKTSINSSNEVAKLATSLVTLGKTESEIINLLEPVNNLSIALQAPADAAGELLVKTLNAFQESTTEAERYADIIAKIRTSTALDFEQIKDSLGFLAPTAKAVGLSFEETGALLGVLVDNGVKAARAGRLLNSSFARLIDEGLTLEDALSRINNSANKTAEAANLFGREAFGLGLILAENIDKTKEYTQTFEESAGSLQDLTDNQLESLSAQIKILNSAWEEFVLSIENGEGVISKSIKAAIKGFTSLLIVLSELGNSDGFKRSREDAKKWADTIKDEDIEKNLKKARMEVDKLSESVEDLKTKADLEGDDFSFEAGEQAAKKLENLEPRLVKFQELVKILELRQLAIVEESEIKKQKARKKNLEEQRAALEELKKQQEETLKNVVEIDKKERESSINIEGAREAARQAFERVEKAKTKIADLEAKERERIAREEEQFKQSVLNESLDLAFNTLSTFANQRADNEQIRRENELLAIEQQTESELALAGDNEERKAQIEKQAEARRKKVLREQAEAEKKRTINNIALSILEGVARAVAASPATFGLPFSAFVLANGAVQLAAANSQPIPQFEEGTKGKEHKGLAVVNEQFKSKGSEIFRQGQSYFTMNTDGPALVNFQKPTEVIGYKDMEYMDKGNPLGLISRKTAMNVNNNGFNDSRMISKLDKVDQSIKEIKLNVNVKGKGTNSYKLGKMKSLNIIRK